MGKEEKKVARKRFDEIMGVAKNHHLANLLKDKGEDENFEVSDLRYAMENWVLHSSNWVSYWLQGPIWSVMKLLMT